MECSCKTCQNACAYKPGWFLPGEIEKVAEYLNKPLKEVFDEYLAVDWYQDVPKDIFVIAPAIPGTKGGIYTADPRGKCTFYKEGKCSIHPVKPFECREYHHGEDSVSISDRHSEVAEEWKDNQQQVEDLLGIKPYTKEYYGWLY